MQPRHRFATLCRERNEMRNKQRSSRCRVRLATFVGAFLAAAVAVTSQAGTAVVQAKSISSRAKGMHPEAKAAPVKVSKPVNNPFPSVHRDLLTLEDGQKSLERQLESVISATRWRTDDLERQIGTFNDQLSRLALQQQDLSTTQQLLTVTIRSMRLLLMVISGLLTVLCGVLFFLVYQVRQFDGFRFREGKQINPAPSEAPGRAYEPQWKVGS